MKSWSPPRRGVLESRKNRSKGEGVHSTKIFCKKCDVLLLSISLTGYSSQMIVQTQSRHCCYDHLKERSTHTSHWSQFPKEEAVLSLSGSMIHNYMTQVFKANFSPCMCLYICVYTYIHTLCGIFSWETIRNERLCRHFLYVGVTIWHHFSIPDT